MNGVIIVVLFVMLLTFIDYKFAQRKLNQKRLSYIMRWGELNPLDKNQEKLAWIKEKYEYDMRNQEENQSLNDVTWNDFEMDDIFWNMNTTMSTMGELSLYKILRNPLQDATKLKQRDRLIQELQSNETVRNHIGFRMSMIGKSYTMTIDDYFDKIHKIKRYQRWPLVGAALLFALAIAMLGIYQEPAGTFLLASLGINIFVHYKTKRHVENVIPFLVLMVKMLKSMRGFSKESEQEIFSDAQATFAKADKVIRKLSRYIVLIQLEYNGIKSEADGVLDSIRMLTHCDLLILPIMLKVMIENESLLKQCYEEVGYLDSMIAVANYREFLANNQGYCVPDFIRDTTHRYEVTQLYYPLIFEEVPNDLKCCHPILITGSNATGKSTFLRSVGVAAVMAQSIVTVCAEFYHASLFYVMSSMCIRDNVMEEESYYLKEIKTLKQILDTASQRPDVLCCLDEVMKGTNTKERVSAATEILLDLNSKNVMCFAASHDMELTTLLSEAYDNYHFTEQVLKDSIQFDYKLYQGQSTTCNAIELLRIIGYPEEIVERAKKRALQY